LVQELDEAGWAKVLDAGPGLLALELRQLGGAFATPAANGGALDHFAAPLHYYGVGMAGETTTHDLQAVRSALHPYLTGRTAPNFVDHFQQPRAPTTTRPTPGSSVYGALSTRPACSPAMSTPWCDGAVPPPSRRLVTLTAACAA
jgi:hypothetical protein